jgi:hypothetical protein
MCIRLAEDHRKRLQFFWIIGSVEKFECTKVCGFFVFDLDGPRRIPPRMAISHSSMSWLLEMTSLQKSVKFQVLRDMLSLISLVSLTRTVHRVGCFSPRGLVCVWAPDGLSGAEIFALHLLAQLLIVLFL